MPTSNGKLASAYIAVDPATAARWLDGNNVNRNLRTAKVAQYARDMLAGHWTVSNDAICFAPDGTLLNGQHRLHAVIKSGATVKFWVIRNMPAEAMSTMDTGASRTQSDVLKFSGEKNAAILAATLRQLVLMDTGLDRDGNTQSVSHAEQAGFLIANPEVRHSTDTAANAKKQVDAPPTPLAVAHWMIAAVNGANLADLYLTQLAKRTDEPAGSAIHAVNSRLREARRQRQTHPTRNYVYLLIKGWNYYAVGQPVQKLAMTPKGEFQMPPVAKWRRLLAA